MQSAFVKRAAARSLVALQQILDPASVVGAARLVTDGRIRLVDPSALARFGRDLVRRGRRGHADLLHLHALNTPHLPALVSYSERGVLRLDWHTLDARVTRLANGLHALGVRQRDRVAALLHNGHEQIELSIAATLVGATIVHIGYRLKAKEVAFLLADSGARAIVLQPSHLAVVEEAIAEAGTPARSACIVSGERAAGMTSYEDLIERGADGELPPTGGDSQGGIMVYTSGTTGKPKGADRQLKDTGYGPILNFIADLPMRYDERHLVVCPLYHSAAQFFATITMALGGTLVVLENFDPEEVLRTIERERISSTCLVPTMWNRLVSLGHGAIRKHDLSSLRWVMSAAAPLPTELAGRIEDVLGPLLYNFYGATETGVVTLARPGEHTARPGTIGRLVRGSEIRLLDPEGREVPVGEVGEVWVRNRMMMSGYFGNPDATRAASRDGFYSVGDLGRRDADGYYYLADRKNDMVITGGVNVYPLEIEQRLHAHPAVHDVAVVGQPDADWGESLAAFVVLNPGTTATAEELAAWVGAELADFKKPRRVIFVDALPRNPTGKVLKRELRQRLSPA